MTSLHFIKIRRFLVSINHNSLKLYLYMNWARFQFYNHTASYCSGQLSRAPYSTQSIRHAALSANVQQQSWQPTLKLLNHDSSFRSWALVVKVNDSFSTSTSLTCMVTAAQESRTHPSVHRHARVDDVLRTFHVVVAQIRNPNEAMQTVIQSAMHAWWSVLLAFQILIRLPYSPKNWFYISIS